MDRNNSELRMGSHCYSTSEGNPYLSVYDGCHWRSQRLCFSVVLITKDLLVSPCLSLRVCFSACTTTDSGPEIDIEVCTNTCRNISVLVEVRQKERKLYMRNCTCFSAHLEYLSINVRLRNALKCVTEENKTLRITVYVHYTLPQVLTFLATIKIHRRPVLLSYS
jgi:hypothetical protein